MIAEYEWRNAACAISGSNGTGEAVSAGFADVGEVGRVDGRYGSIGA